MDAVILIAQREFQRRQSRGINHAGFAAQTERVQSKRFVELDFRTGAEKTGFRKGFGLRDQGLGSGFAFGFRSPDVLPGERRHQAGEIPALVGAGRQNANAGGELVYRKEKGVAIRRELGRRNDGLSGERPGKEQKQENNSDPGRFFQDIAMVLDLKSVSSGEFNGEFAEIPTPIR